jgi:hypothetical protein
VVDGTAPLDPEAVLYVERRGTFALVRREEWPGERTLLTLAGVAVPVGSITEWR